MKKSVIEMHSTWLAVNSIIGCTNGCKYCFLQSTNHNLKKPMVLVDVKEAVRQLLSSNYYDESIPVCLLPNTDSFLNHDNIEYLKELLYELKKKNVKNVLTIVTKCKIPEDFIQYIKDIHMDNQLVFYLSYSGLGKDIEPNVDIEKIKENFPLLHRYHLKMIHYFRPLIPINSKPEKIDSILDFVHQYTPFTVITGLKIKKEYFDQIDFWDEIKNHKNACIQAEGVWVKDAFDYFYQFYHKQQYIFQTNACALASILDRPIPEYYDSFECKNYNICSVKQKELCKNCRVETVEQLKDKVILGLKKIKKFHRNIIIDISDIILIQNVELEVGDLAYLTYLCHKKVVTQNKSKNDHYFNSSLNGSKPLVLER